MPRPSPKALKRTPIGPAPAAAAARAAASEVGSSTTVGSGRLVTTVPVVRSSSAIKSLLERRRTDTIPGVEESLSLVAVGEIGFNDSVDRFRHGFGAEARTNDGADGRGVLRIAAERDLVEFGDFLVDTEHADIAGMVMAAGVDAARQVQPQRTD